MKNLLTQINIAPKDGFKGIGPLGNPGIGLAPALTFSNFISGVIGVMTIIAIIWAIFSIITGAISIISSGGDKQALESARKKITTGIIGLIIVFVALLIVDLVGYLLGLKNILDFKCLFNLVSGGTCAGGP